jgi:drug/metabolite transporter (DMT)-like permease
MSLPVLFGLLLAAACAVATNVASVLKHRGANATPRLRARHPLRSVRLLFGSRWFALGMGLAMFAGMLHIAALVLAPMSIVQVVLAGGVVLLAGLAERLLGCTVPRRQRIGLAAAAAGLVLLVLAAPPLHGAHGAFATPTLIAFEAAVALAGCALALGPRLRILFANRGVLLGAAGGAFFGVSDIAVKAVTGLAGSGAVLPWLATAVAGGIAAQFVAVRGLQEGEAVPVIALTGVTANVANILGGIVVFGDPIAHGPLAWSAQSLAFALVVLGSALVPAGAIGPRERARAAAV